MAKIYIDYTPNDILYSCFFPPNIHFIHAVIFEAVTEWEIFKLFFIISVYRFLRMCFGEIALYTKVSHQWIFLKKNIMRDFYCLPRYLFIHRRLAVTCFAVVCVYIFWLHFFCNDVLRMPCMGLKIQQYDKLEKDDDWFKRPIISTTFCYRHTRTAVLSRRRTAISIF